MGALSFLNPAYLGALALAALPILIHLIRKRRVRVVAWAAWDFLAQSTRRSRRRLRVEQWLLLLTRVALICLVVLAFCRPLLRTLGLPFAAAGSRVRAIIALDVSRSMGYRSGRESDFDRARRAADGLLSRALKPGDAASLVLLSDRPDAVVRDPTLNLNAVRNRVRAVRPGDRGTDYGAGAALCATLLRESRGDTPEVYWITDSQRNGFRDADREQMRTAWAALTRGARVTWIDVSSPDRENLGVGAPVFSRELVTPQSPVRLAAAIRNYGSKTRQGVLVHLQVDGREAGSTVVNVPPNGQAIASFLYLFDRPGLHSGRLRVDEADGLEADNTAWFALRVRERLRVLVINPHPNADPARDDAFYLSTALAPSGASAGAVSPIAVTVRAGTSLAGISLRDYDTVAITGLAPFGAVERRALEEYARAGGGLLLFPGAATDPAAVNRAFGAAQPADSLLPALLEAKRTLPESGAVALNPATIAHPALSPFRDAADVDLGSAQVTAVQTIRPPTDAGSGHVMVRFSDGAPALVERAFGQGRVILAAFPAGVMGSGLPYKPAYVPLMHQLVAYLAAGPGARRNLRVGEPIQARFSVRAGGAPVRITPPSGRTLLRPAALGAAGVLLTYAGTEQAGPYRLEAAGGRESELYAVNAPEEESDLATADERRVRAALGPGAFQYVRGGADPAEMARRARTGTEIWRALALAAIPLLFLEALLAQRFGRRT